MLVSKEEYQGFLKHYEWQLIKSPDYRLGQAFLNYFPWVRDSMGTDGDLGHRDLFQVWQSSNRLEVLDLVDWYIEDNE